MNLGGRIKKRLDALGKKPMWLCDQVNGLSPRKELTIGNLSAMIQRDSKKSEFASAIAVALGVNLDWLLTGDGEELCGTPDKEKANPENLKPDLTWPFETISRKQWEGYPVQFRHHVETLIMSEAVEFAELIEKHGRGFQAGGNAVRKSSNGK